MEIPVPGAPDRNVSSNSASSAFSVADLRPFIEVALVPIPAAFGLLVIATIATGALRLRLRDT